MKRSPSPSIDYLDERRGYWTEIEFYDSYLVIRRSHRMHSIALTFSVLIIGLLIAGLLQSVAVLLIIAGFILTTANGQRIADRKRFPIVFCQNVKSAKADFEHGRYFDRKLVRKIIVRENKNRSGDDFHLVQIYMKVKEVDNLVLLYQQAWTVESEEKTEEFAKQIREWLVTT